MRSVLRGAVIVGWVLAASSWAGCASEDPNNSGGQANNQTGSAATGGTGGASGSGGDLSGFGNGNGNTGGEVGGGGTGADAGCPLGMVCQSTNPDPNDCGSFAIEGDVKTVMMPGNIMVIFDRSGSMADDWNPGMPKWQAAGSAMISALTAFQDQLTIGAVFYPDNTLVSCIVKPATDIDQVAFMPGAMAIAKMNAAAPSNGVPNPLYGATLGQTPTLEGIQAADAAITAAMDPGAAVPLVGTLAVIVVTDGDPNCGWNQQSAVDIVTKWNTNGIKTYVLGVPGVGGTGVATLNVVAAAGGTMQYIPPTDATTLQQKIRDIVQQTVKVGFDSCTINFDPPAEAPEKVFLVVTENGVDQSMPRDFSGKVAWTITADGKTVELVGDLCAAAKAGAYDRISFQFGCVDLPPAPPPIVVE